MIRFLHYRKWIPQCQEHFLPISENNRLGGARSDFTHTARQIDWNGITVLLWIAHYQHCRKYHGNDDAENTQKMKRKVFGLNGFSEKSPGYKDIP